MAANTKQLHLNAQQQPYQAPSLTYLGKFDEKTFVGGVSIGVDVTSPNWNEQ